MAISDIKKVRKQAPHDLNYAVQEIQLYYKYGKKNKAFSLLKNISKDKAHWALLHLGKFLLRTKKGQEAHQVFVTLASDTNYRVPGYLGLALANYILKEKNKTFKNVLNKN